MNLLNIYRAIGSKAWQSIGCAEVKLCDSLIIRLPILSFQSNRYSRLPLITKSESQNDKKEVTIDLTAKHVVIELKYAGVQQSALRRLELSMGDDSEKYNYEWKQRVFQQSIEYSGKLEERHFSINIQTNKMIIALSSGTLALSMSTLNRLFDHPINLSMLRWSWCLFLCTIMLVFLGLSLSGNAIKKQIILSREYYNNAIKNPEGPHGKPPKNPYSIFLVIISSLTAVAFMTGYVFLGLFVMSNSYKEASNGGLKRTIKQTHPACAAKAPKAWYQNTGHIHPVVTSSATSEPTQAPKAPKTVDEIYSFKNHGHGSWQSRQTGWLCSIIPFGP